MREMLADMGSKFFVEVVCQKCIKLRIVCLVGMHDQCTAVHCCTERCEWSLSFRSN